MDNNRLNYHVFKWSHSIKTATKNWCYRVDKVLKDNVDITINCDTSYSRASQREIIDRLANDMFKTYTDKWLNIVNANPGCNGGNKLRKYLHFKNEYNTETYVNMNIMTRQQRSALAKFRCGVAPLKIETGRYQSLNIEDRTCFNCLTEVEDEIHVLIKCPLYKDIRNELFLKMVDVNPDFSQYDTITKFNYIMSNDRNIKYSAKACSDILYTRRDLICK